MSDDIFDPIPELEAALGTSFTDDLSSAAHNLARQYGHAFARKYGLDSVPNVLKTINGLYNWIPTEDFTASEVYDKLCAFYLFFDTAPLAHLQNRIRPSSYPPPTPLSLWIINYAKGMGSNLSKPGSLTPQSLQTFIQSPSYHIADYFPGGVVPPLPLTTTLGWNNFNEFFSRQMPDIDIVRPIASPEDDTVVVSPADFTFGGQWPIGPDGTVILDAPISVPSHTTRKRILRPHRGPGVAVTKGIPWAISELLGPAGPEYASQFDGGTFIHGFLSTHDYHRQHAPVSGPVVFAKRLDGLCYMQVDVVHDSDGAGRSIVMSRYLDAPDSPGYQFIQARGLILIDNPILGLVAMLPIGMAQVSSVEFTKWEPEGIPIGGTDPPTYVAKGEEVSRFLFGGSDCIVCFGPKAKMVFNAYSGDWLRARSQIGFSRN